MSSEEFRQLLDELRKEIRRGRERTLGDRVWEIAMKATVPLVMIVGAAIIRGEIRGQDHETRITRNEEELKLRPPPWLREALNEIKIVQRAQDGRLQRIETDLAALKAKVK